MNKVLIGQGLQYKVYLDNSNSNRVYKIPTSKKEKLEFLDNLRPRSIKNFLISDTLITKNNARIIKEGKIPSFIFANPIFENDSLVYTQDILTIPYSDMDHTPENIFRVINDYVQLLKFLWTYGLHDRVIKPFVNCGYNQSGSLVLCDFSELTNNFQRAIKLVKAKNWINSSNIQLIPSEIIKENVIDILNTELTLCELKKLWKTNLNDK
jgi:hypothetical protein